ncbi:MAG TPA: DUF2218 domain-containing protein [Streptomyces sp.]|nr:DUF2218 domain-containing protein [Streptomyces sp.]
MLTAEATVPTTRAHRYLNQLCRHAVQMRHHMPTTPTAHGDTQTVPKVRRAESSETEGTIEFDAGTCHLRATQDALLLRLEAQDDHGLRLLRDGLTTRLEKIGRRDSLTVDWQGSDPQAMSRETTTRTPSRRGRGQVIGLVAVGILVVAVHLGLGGALLESSQWAGWAADLVLAVVVLKLLVIAGHVVLGRWALRRRRSSRVG